MKNINFLFIFLAVSLLITSCSAKEQKVKSDLPVYTQKLLGIAYGCKCEVGGTPAIICKCDKPEWEKTIRITCKNYPTDLNSAVDNCVAMKEKK